MRMRKERPLIMLALAVSVMLAAAVSAHAADYTFDGVQQAEYYTDTETRASDYYEIPEIPYGSTSRTQTGPIEKACYPTAKVMYLEDPLYGSAAYRANAITIPTAFTSAATMIKSDGTMGTISIPSMNVSFKVRDGETTANMNKGFAHYSMSSGWDGNVCVCAHNRGCKYAIGGIKDIEAGEIITYETIYGTRIYAVESVSIIGNTDWSRLGPTADNRLTITTCLANHPEVRVCVQAAEIK